MTKFFDNDGKQISPQEVVANSEASGEQMTLALKEIAKISDREVATAKAAQRNE